VPDHLARAAGDGFLASGENPVLKPFGGKPVQRDIGDVFPAVVDRQGMPLPSNVCNSVSDLPFEYIANTSSVTFSGTTWSSFPTSAAAARAQPNGC